MIPINFNLRRNKIFSSIIIPQNFHVLVEKRLLAFNTNYLLQNTIK